MTSKLILYAGKVYYNAKQTLDSGERNKEILLGLKRKVIQTSDKFVKYGDLGDRQIVKLDDKLFKVEIHIAEEERIQNRKILPEPKLMVWSGEILEYRNFRKQMAELVNYGNDELDLETIKQEIKLPLPSSVFSK